GGSSIPAGGVIEFRNSTIEVLDGDLLDAFNNGSLSLITLYAPIRLIDNVLIRTHDSTALVVQESELGEGDIDIIGNVDVRVGVSEAESAAGARPAVFVATTNSPSGSWRNRVTVEGNTITATADVQFVPADLADMHVKDNVITSGGVGPTGAVIMAVTGEGELEVTGNDFTFTSVVTIQAANLAGGTLVLAGNSFTSVTETSGI